MGIYLNPGNVAFRKSLNSEIYIDKSGLIAYTNEKLNTEQQYICVNRPRRFGKSMAANMLAAYYSRGCDSETLFQNLKIASHPDFKKHLNQYHVIYLNMQDFLGESEDMEEMLQFIEEDLLEELMSVFSKVRFPQRKSLIKVLASIFEEIKIPFVVIIDEWDCVFRVYKTDCNSQTKYLNFLRNLLKDKSYIALVYMTGILPIKKYGEHSAINVFYEHSMTDMEPISEFTGFTEQEVKELCEKYGMPFEEAKEWYDGYYLNRISVYNPKSVVEAMLRRNFNNYWTKTETYEALKLYIEMDFDGLRDKIIRMIAGEKVLINPEKFQNDMATFKSSDDVLTLLVHLGYLTFNFNTKEVWIPNSEIQQEFINSIEDGGWENVMNSIKMSEQLLRATLTCNEEEVARMIEQVHQENISILQYHNENALSCVISLAYYSARKSYHIYREMPSGKGFADLVFVPQKRCNSPAFIVELKWDKTARIAIDQIVEKEYAECLKNYSGEVLLVGINYDKNSKKHSCCIEKWHQKHKSLSEENSRDGF